MKTHEKHSLPRNALPPRNNSGSSRNAIHVRRPYSLQPRATDVSAWTPSFGKVSLYNFVKHFLSFHLIYSFIFSFTYLLILFIIYDLCLAEQFRYTYIPNGLSCSFFPAHVNNTVIRGQFRVNMKSEIPGRCLP